MRITEKDTLEEITETESIDKISTTSVLVVHNEQVVMSKSILLGIGWNLKTDGRKSNYFLKVTELQQ